MNFGSIFGSLTGSLAAVASALIPGGPVILAAVNAILPDDKKLPETATGNDIADAVNALPPEQRASLMSKEIDLQIAQEEGWTARYKAMTEGDGQSTRPRIALMMAQVTCFVILLFAAAIAVQILTEGLDSLAESAGAWTVFATLLGIPSGVLAKYFGELRKEQQSRLGSAPGGLLGNLAGILGKVK